VTLLRLKIVILRAAACLGVNLAGGGLAHASPVSRLDYARAQDAEMCPTEAQLRAAVSGRLGYDPFGPDATQTVVARIQREQGALRATVTLVQQDGSTRERAPLVSHTMECSELSEALSLAISIAVDPLSFARGPGATTPSPAPPPVASPHVASPPVASPPTAPIEQPSPPPPRTRRFDVRAGFTFSFRLGWAPTPSASAGAFAGVASGPFAIHLEGLHDFGASEGGPAGGSVRSSITTGAVVPCVEVDWLSACAQLHLGTLSGSGSDVLNPRDRTDFFAATGLRGAIEVPLRTWLGLRAQIDATYTLTPLTLRIARADVWRTPSIGGAVGLGAVGHFR